MAIFRLPRILPACRQARGLRSTLTTTGDAAARPVPVPDAASAPFFDAAARGELLLQRCLACGAFMFPVRPCCAECLSGALDWAPAGGSATLYSYTVIHQPVPGFRSPFVLATGETPEGVRFNANIVDADAAELSIGMPLKIGFEQLSEGVAIPVFRVAP